jgi:hypothetical protein
MSEQGAEPVMVLTVHDLGILLRVPDRTLRRWRADGKILDPLPIDDLKEPRWLASEVKAWLAARCPRAEEWRSRREAAVPALAR